MEVQAWYNFKLCLTRYVSDVLSLRSSVLRRKGWSSSSRFVPWWRTKVKWFGVKKQSVFLQYLSNLLIYCTMKWHFFFFYPFLVIFNVPVIAYVISHVIALTRSPCPLLHSFLCSLDFFWKQCSAVYTDGMVLSVGITVISSSLLDDETVEEPGRSIRERSTLRSADEDVVKRKVGF